jgi:hypothetical protein
LIQKEWFKNPLPEDPLVSLRYAERFASTNNRLHIRYLGFILAATW